MRRNVTREPDGRITEVFSGTLRNAGFATATWMTVRSREIVYGVYVAAELGPMVGCALMLVVLVVASRWEFRDCVARDCTVCVKS